MGSLAVAILFLSGAAPCPASEWRPWISVGGGHESDIILTGTPDRAVVAGGSFSDISGGFTIDEELSPAVDFTGGARSFLEKFFNADGRLMHGESIWAETRFAGRGAFRMRLSGGGDFFNDSQRPQSRRLGGHLGAAVGAGGAGWRLETFGGLEGRRYPRLDSNDESGATGTYTENGWNAGVSGMARPVAATYVRATFTHSDVDARDPWYDSGGNTASADAWFRVRDGFWLSCRGLYQRREFDQRPAGVDTDDYLLAGCGIETSPAVGLRLSLRYAFSRYEPTAGDDVDSHRFAAALTWRPRLEAPAPIERFEPLVRPRAGSAHLFRLHAPGAGRVSVAGSFNGWDAQADPMTRTAGGWWETAIPLAAGSHQYIYVVDGQATIPPEAEAVTDDGFGGENGVLHVLPAEL